MSTSGTTKGGMCECVIDIIVETRSSVAFRRRTLGSNKEAKSTKKQKTHAVRANRTKGYISTCSENDVGTVLRQKVNVCTTIILSESPERNKTVKIFHSVINSGTSGSKPSKTVYIFFLLIEFYHGFWYRINDLFLIKKTWPFDLPLTRIRVVIILFWCYFWSKERVVNQWPASRMRPTLDNFMVPMIHQTFTKYVYFVQNVFYTYVININIKMWLILS